VVEDQGTRLSALRERIVRGEYEVDSRAVAEAMLHRVWELALSGSPLKAVLIAGELAGLVSEDDPDRTV
jgi:Anti-sigma-28 factor, FlgM